MFFILLFSSAEFLRSLFLFLHCFLIIRYHYLVLFIMRKNVKAAIVGSRSFTDYEKMRAFIAKIRGEQELFIYEVISGGATGADKLAEQYATDTKKSLTIFKPDWKLGRGAGIQRNEKIIQACDVCFAFWDGESRGTKSDIEFCTKMGKPCYICRFDS